LPEDRCENSAALVRFASTSPNILWNSVSDALQCGKGAACALTAAQNKKTRRCRAGFLLPAFQRNEAAN